MKTKILVMAVIEKDEAVLMRKKPFGAPPYKELWYSFGAEAEEGISPESSLATYLRDKIGIEVTVGKHLGWDTEIKKDLDGEVKQFIYLDTLCKFVSGKIHVPIDIEKIEWVPKKEL